MTDERRLALALARAALATAEAYEPSTPFDKMMKATNVEQIRRQIATLEARLAHPAAGR